MTTITTSPPKPPKPEITVGPWDIADWSVQNYGPRPEDGPLPTRRLGVAVKVVHRYTGETRRQGVLSRLSDVFAKDQDGRRAAVIAQSKLILRQWVDDLNAAEREDQPA